MDRVGAEERGGLRPPSSAGAAALPGVGAAPRTAVSRLRGTHEQTGKLMSLFLTLRTAHLPQALSQVPLCRSIPAAKAPHSDQPKNSPCSQHLVLQTQVFSRSQYCSGFCSLLLYKRKLFKSHKMTVNFSNQVHRIRMILSVLWYTTPVLMKGRANFMCWCSHL